MPTLDYIARLQWTDLAIRLSVNDHPVHASTEPGTWALDTRMNAYVVEGDSSLRLDLGPLPSRGFPPRLRLRVLKILDREEQKDDPPLLHYCHRAEEHPLSAEGMTTVLEHSMRVRSAFGRWAWESAIPYAESDRPGIVAGVAALHEAFSTKDRPRLKDLLGLKLAELARALGADPQARMTSIDAMLDALLTDTWVVKPLDPARLVARSSAGGRLVTVTTAAGEPPIEGRNAEHGLALPVVMTRVGGAWAVVR